MSPSATSYLIGAFLVFLGERMFEGTPRYALDGVGALLVLVALGLRAASLGKHPAATKRALGFYAVSLLALVLYALSDRDMAARFGLEGESAARWRVALQALTPLVWAIGALPAIAIDRTLHASPHSVHPLRLRTALEGGLALALGLGMLFPINYLATEYNERFDYSFFKTTAVGPSTRELVENVDEPIRAVLFFPSASDVLREVRPYFDDLEGANLTVEVMDMAMVPDLAKQWKVREDGVVAFVKGEAVETVKIGVDEKTARKELRQLDSKVQTALLKLAREKRTAYFTVGHEEFFWKNAAAEDENTDTLKKVVEQLNFKVKELGLDDGLAQAVPDDAAVVFITGPRKPFLAEEVAALEAYRDRGGAVFLMLEPSDTPDPALAAAFGVTYSAAPLLSDKRFVPITRGIADRANIGTEKFGSHESVTALNKAGPQAAIITPKAVAVAEATDHPGKVTVTVKGSPEWWTDLDGNFEFDDAMEKRGGSDIAVVASGPAANDTEWRAAVIGDATWASNVFLRQVAGSQLYLIETIGWLTQDPALGGEVENEEDVKIQHSREGEAAWFYGTSVFVPALVFIGGMVRVARRRKKGAA
jgi:hypothetical protein